MQSSATARRLFATTWRRGMLVDAALAAAAVGCSLVLLGHAKHLASGSGHSGLTVGSAALAVLAAGPLLLWRRAPFLALLAAATADIVAAGLGYPLGLPLGMIATLHLYAASRDEGDRWTAPTAAAVVALSAAYLAATGFAKDSFPGIEAFHTGLALAVAWFAGERVRLRREQIAALEERLAGAAHEGEKDRQLAVVEERMRIARDLHDAAGHTINVIAVRAGAARLHHNQDPDRSLAALEAIEELARTTAAEIDHMVGVLRSTDRDGEVEPPPGLASLRTLLAQHASAGLDVVIDVEGAPRALSGSVDQAAYRILQEALTNASRHGAGPARVDLAYRDAELDVTVANPVHAAVGTDPALGGHGLIGMRERALVLGGDVVARRIDGTFRVEACLPYGGLRR